MKLQSHKLTLIPRAKNAGRIADLENTTITQAKLKLPTAATRAVLFNVAHRVSYALHAQLPAD